MARTSNYKIRSFSNGASKGGKAFMNYSLTVPAAIAEALPKDKTYECVLTDDGILYRPVDSAAEEQIPLPAWADAAPKRNARKRRATQAA